MAWVFDDDIQVNGDERGDFVFCWGWDEDDPDVKRVRVQAGRAVVADWGVDWSNKEAVKEAFRARRDAWLAIAASAPDTGGGTWVLEIR